jgi:type I restriction enzyme S subunit
MSELPRGWVEQRLSEVCELITDGTHHSPSNGVVGEFKYVTAKNIKKHGLDLTNITYVDAPTHREIYKRCPVKLGDVLYIKDGATTGLAIVNPLEEQFSMLSSVALLRPSRTLLNAHFLRHQLNSRSLRERMTGDMTGSAIRRLTLTTIGRQEVAVPPLAEQKRIVTKLDALNAKSARARTELARIETLVSRYKQAVLRKAFSGELSRSQARFSQFIETAGNGLSKREGDEGDWTNVLRLTDLKQGQFAPEEPRQIRLTRKEVDKYGLTEGDLVVIRVNGSANLVGRSFCFKASDDWAFCDHFIRIRLKSTFNADFAALFLNSPPIRSIIEHKFVSTSGQKTISQKTLEELPAPQLPLEEQHEIVRRIESAFARIDRLAGQAKRALELVGRLDEAVLAKAFRGELVPQDENDEPAELLLARIRAEREAAPKGRRGRKASA